MQSRDEQYMQRCIELALKGAGSVAPNPMVGAVLVHEDKIIAEGWHQRFGEAHAELNCINEAVQKGLAHLIPQSTLYVSLEPCAHQGKTPPCSNLIIQNRIPKVVIGCSDSFEAVNGKGIEQLLKAGIHTIVGVLQKECLQLNQRFFTYHQQYRPYIILKWAATADGKIAGNDQERLLISHPITNRLVHQWRQSEAAILIGTNTALFDNPQLNNRYWKGAQPLRVVLDQNLRLPSTLQLFNDHQKTIILNRIKEGVDGDVQYYQLQDHENLILAINQALYQLQLQSVIVEGGAQLLQSFIDASCWDEARVITNKNLRISGGLMAPQLKNAMLQGSETIQNDQINYYRPSVQHS